MKMSWYDLSLVKNTNQEPKNIENQSANFEIIHLNF